MFVLSLFRHCLTKHILTQGKIIIPLILDTTSISFLILSKPQVIVHDIVAVNT